MRFCSFSCYISATMLIFTSFLIADTITVYNKTNTPVYAAAYYKRGGTATRCSDIYRV